MTLHRSCLLALLLAVLSLSGASVDTGVFVRFKLLEPPETSYYIQIGGYSTSSHGLSRRSLASGS